MRDGVTFHDGTPADGAAVQRSLDRDGQRPAPGPGARLDLSAGRRAPWSMTMTVTVTFDKPFATFREQPAGRTGWLIAPRSGTSATAPATSWSPPVRSS